MDKEFRFTSETSVHNTGSDFETFDNLCAKATVVKSTSRKVDSCGIVMDGSEPETFVTSPRDSHIGILGTTGSGKSRRVMVPSILMQAKTGTSMVITDPKGELYRFTANDLKKMGYNIHSINLRNPSRGSRWNPLSYVEKYYRSPSVEDRDKAEVMLMDIANVLKGNIHSSKDIFWEQASSNLFLGISQMILEKGEPGTLTFENVFNVGREMLLEVLNNKANAMNDDYNRPKPRLTRYFDSLSDFNPIKRNLSMMFMKDSDRLVESILMTFVTMLNPYISQEALSDLTCRSEIEFEDIGQRPTALYLLLPDDSAALYPFAAIMVKQIYSVLIRQADENTANGGRLNNEVFFFLDEFGTICGSNAGSVIPDFPMMMSAGRSRGFRFVIVCQSIGQLSVNYSSQEADTILGNCDTLLYLNSRDMATIERFQRQIGKYISPNTGREMPLISTQDLQKIELGRLLVINKCCGPYWGQLKDFTECDFGPKVSLKELGLPPARTMIDRQHIGLDDLLGKKPAPKKHDYSLLDMDDESDIPF